MSVPVRDISSFMTWFLSEMVRIMTWVFLTLDSIQFGGTSLLRVIIGLVILGGAVPIIMTLVNNSGRLIYNQGERIRHSSERSKNDNK